MIERSYPAVYLDEVAFKARPIDGVPTAQPAVAAPAWTDANAHDPGVTLPGVFRFLTEPALQGVEGSETAAKPIDLAALVSRYIGETEKNLHAAFAAAQSSGAVLHYDESQSLFRDKP